MINWTERHLSSCDSTVNMVPQSFPFVSLVWSYYKLPKQTVTIYYTYFLETDDEMCFYKGTSETSQEGGGRRFLCKYTQVGPYEGYDVM